MTNVFISWGGELSKSLGEELRKWIPAVLQFAKPYFTPNDIEKGSKWGSEISRHLAETDVGIVCLTRENIDRPWILFEAGALSKNLDGSRVCSVLFGIDNTDLSGPLTTFQTTSFEKADFKKMMMTINDAGGDSKLALETFENVFEMWWPKLEEAVTEIMNDNGSDEPERLRSDREILEEVLSLARMSSRSLRLRPNSDVSSALVHLANLGQSLLSEARNYGDRDILNAVDEMQGAIDFLSRNLDAGSAKSRRGLLSLAGDIEETRAFLSSKQDDDDEIPF